MTGQEKAAKVLGLQALLLAMLLLGFAKTIFALTPTIFFAVQAGLGLAYFFLLYQAAQKEKERWPFLAFFFLLWLLVQASLALNFLLADFAMQTQAVILLMVFALAMLLVFRFFFSRNYTTGTVLLSDKSTALVQTDFDLLSFSSLIFP